MVKNFKGTVEQRGFLTIDNSEYGDGVNLHLGGNVEIIQPTREFGDGPYVRGGHVQTLDRDFAKRLFGVRVGKSAKNAIYGVKVTIESDVQ